MHHRQRFSWTQSLALLLAMAGGTALGQMRSAMPAARLGNAPFAVPHSLNPYFMGSTYPMTGAHGSMAGSRSNNPYAMPRPSGGYGGASGGYGGAASGYGVPAGGMDGAGASATVSGTSETTTNAHVNDPATTLLRASGVPSDHGHIRWPVGLRSLAAPQAAELLTQLDALFGSAVGQGNDSPVNAQIDQEIDRDVRQLRRLVFLDREERGALPQDVYEEADRFLDKLARAEKLLQAGLRGPGPKAQMGTEATLAVVRLHDNEFQPADLTVPVGVTVRWINDGQHHHTVTSDDERWGSEQLGPGDAYKYMFTRPGTYHYRCAVHPDVMWGTITVK